MKKSLAKKFAIYFVKVFLVKMSQILFSIMPPLLTLVTLGDATLVEVILFVSRP